MCDYEKWLVGLNQRTYYLQYTISLVIVYMCIIFDSIRNS